VRNEFSYNYEDSLFIITKGTVVISKMDDTNNSQIGINVDTVSGTGTVTMSDVYAKENSGSGVAIEANNTINLTKLNIYRNGLAGSASGVTVISNNANINVTTSNILGNASYGIQATAGSGTLTIKQSNYFGNHFFVLPVGMPNINMISGTLVIIP
jgi:nitrous oxidase accessory protein NosD